MRSMELNNPKSRNATDFNGTKVRNAPTVVMFPTTSGIAISFSAVLMSGVCCICAIKWSG